MNILITGGAGFVGSSLAKHLKDKYTSWKVTAFDNLRRAGSENNLQDLHKKGIYFVHGDVRIPTDLPTGKYDTIIDCAADPSVMAGYTSSREYPIHTNLHGTINSLELALKNKSHFILLSTSRVYSVPSLCQLQLKETKTRFNILENQNIFGCGPEGITEEFPTTRYRSLYGTSKLASEMFLQEYHHAFSLPTTATRFGVIAGPGQLAKPDQGILTFWLEKHIKKEPLKYIGFNGKQTRDVLDVRDLLVLLEDQILQPHKWNGQCFNAGGGLKNSFSLIEATELCREITGQSLDIETLDNQRLMDIPIYVTDNNKITKFSSWTPKIPLKKTMIDTYHHLKNSVNPKSSWTS